MGPSLESSREAQEESRVGDEREDDCPVGPDTVDEVVFRTEEVLEYSEILEPFNLRYVSEFIIFILNVITFPTVSSCCTKTKLSSNFSLFFLWRVRLCSPPYFVIR